MFILILLLKIEFSYKLWKTFRFSKMQINKRTEEIEKGMKKLKRKEGGWRVKKRQGKNITS